MGDVNEILSAFEQGQVNPNLIPNLYLKDRLSTMLEAKNNQTPSQPSAPKSPTPSGHQPSVTTSPVDANKTIASSPVASKRTLNESSFQSLPTTPVSSSTPWKESATDEKPPIEELKISHLG